MKAAASSTRGGQDRSAPATFIARHNLAEQMLSLLSTTGRIGEKAAGGHARRASWDFSKIPIFPSDRPSGPPARSSLSAPPQNMAQSKLLLGAVDSPLEFEADRVADQVMQAQNPARSATAVHPQIGSAPTSGSLAARPLDQSAGDAAGLVFDVLRSPGQALDKNTRAVFERRFGHDFSSVRVHTDERAGRSAQAVDAEAYTAGAHIAFAPNRYAPDTHGGQRSLAHELAHVVQQRFLPDADANIRCSGSIGLQRQPKGGSGQAAQSSPDIAPGLGRKQAQDVDAMIKANDFQAAVDMIVFYAGGGIGKNYSIDTSLLVDEKMTFDSTVTSADATTGMPSWDWINNKAEPSKVKIGPSAFSSVSYLYSVIMHEYQHVLWRQSLANQQKAHQASGHGGMDTDETEAYAWELLHANETGLARFPDDVATVWNRLNEEYQKLDPKAQASSRALAARAFREAQRMVKGSKASLDPFSP